MSADAPCGIRHVQLTDALPDLAAAPGENSVYAVFWWDALPLGGRLFTRGELPVSGSALAALGADAAGRALRARLNCLGADAPAAALARIRSDAGTVRARTSVIICTRDRPEALARCLDSIARCDPAPDEVIVVDNAPQGEATRRLVEARPGIGYVAEARPGLSRARNAGIGAATGEILIFTDDDVEVSAGWLPPILAAFADPEVGCVTGLVLPAEMSSEAEFGFEFDYGGLGRGFVPKTFDRGLLQHRLHAPPVWNIGAGANMAVRRSVVDRIGPFDLRLGAGAAGCSEDSEFWYRALASGWLCRYEPAAVVHHHHRADLAGLRRQMRAYMRGHVAALLVQYGETGHAGNLTRAFLALPWHYAKSVLRALVGSLAPVRRRAVAWECLGLAEGVLTWARWRRAPKFEERNVMQPCCGTAMTTAATGATGATMAEKRPLGAFLGDNPYPGPLTDGLYFRDKMRAIHRVAPERIGPDLLEIGGGQSGLSKLLYPDAAVVNLDFDPAFADAPCNRQPGVRFVAGDARDLPFADASFDMVTMFDLLEHVEDDDAVAAETMRVLRPGGTVLVTTPDAERWRYPYYRALTPICPPEEELFQRWGHVRRGYTPARLAELFGGAPVAEGGFINPWLALNHDIAFSRLSRPARLALHAVVAPASIVGWVKQRPGDAGTEIAAAWRKG